MADGVEEQDVRGRLSGEGGLRWKVFWGKVESGLRKVVWGRRRAVGVVRPDGVGSGMAMPELAHRSTLLTHIAVQAALGWCEVCGGRVRRAAKIMWMSGCCGCIVVTDRWHVTQYIKGGET